MFFQREEKISLRKKITKNSENKTDNSQAEHKNMLGHLKFNLFRKLA